tara:strand:+ start:54 stop:206 length:153 start_codon:yes stop_codon:yes gene_type:complete
MSNEELIAKVKDLEENIIELLESLPQIIKNFIHYDKIEAENNFKEIKEDE